MTVKLRAIILTLTFLCVTSIVSAAPLLPTEFYGTVFINGSPAPAGTNITAIIDNQIVGFNVTGAPGVFGGTGFADPRLVVQGTADGQLIAFMINGLPANRTAEFHPGTTGQIELTAGIASPVSGGSAQPDAGIIGSYAGAQYDSSGQPDQSAAMNPSNRILAPGSTTPPVSPAAESAGKPAVQPVAADETSVIPTTIAAEVPQTTSPQTTRAPGFTVLSFVVLVIVGIGYRFRS